MNDLFLDELMNAMNDINKELENMKNLRGKVEQLIIKNGGTPPGEGNDGDILGRLGDLEIRLLNLETNSPNGTQTTSETKNMPNFDIILQDLGNLKDQINHVPTNDDLQNAINSLKGELTGQINSSKGELTGQINSSKGELTGQINSSKGELTGQINSSKGELTGQINSSKGELTGQINSLKGELTGQINSSKGELTGQINSLKGNTSKSYITKDI